MKSTREIEEVLLLHPAVVDYAVFGVADVRHGKVVEAVVEAREAVTAEELPGPVPATDSPTSSARRTSNWSTSSARHERQGVEAAAPRPVPADGRGASDGRSLA